MTSSKKQKCVHYWICTSGKDGSVEQVCKYCGDVTVVKAPAPFIGNENNWLQNSKSKKKK